MGLFGTGLQRICAVVAASNAVEMARLVRSALRQTRTLELRLDWLTSDSERAQFLAWLRKYKPRSVTLVATCRRREDRRRSSQHSRQHPSPATGAEVEEFCRRSDG